MKQVMLGMLLIALTASPEAVRAQQPDKITLIPQLGAAFVFSDLSEGFRDDQGRLVKLALDDAAFLGLEILFPVRDEWTVSLRGTASATDVVTEGGSETVVSIDTNVYTYFLNASHYFSTQSPSFAPYVSGGVGGFTFDTAGTESVSALMGNLGIGLVTDAGILDGFQFEIRHHIGYTDSVEGPQDDDQLQHYLMISAGILVGL